MGKSEEKNAMAKHVYVFLTHRIVVSKCIHNYYNVNVHCNL